MPSSAKLPRDTIHIQIAARAKTDLDSTIFQFGEERDDRDVFAGAKEIKDRVSLITRHAKVIKELLAWSGYQDQADE